MPVHLLPASAAAFAPRASSVNVVLGSKVEPWLTQNLKRINRVKRPLNSVAQHQRCLTDILSSPNAIWTLASLMLSKSPETDMPSDPLEALFANQLVHLEAYIVHVDMVLLNEVAYKLTIDTIDALVEYHKNVHCVDARANTHDWAEKEQQCKKLHEDFVQAINKFVFRTHVSALEGLEEEGAGELLKGKSQEVKTNIMALMKPLIPPPRPLDAVCQHLLLPSSPAGNMWSQPPCPTNMSSSVDPWSFQPSSPSGTSPAESCSTPGWQNMSINEYQLPSPTPSFSQPYTTGFFFSSPQDMTSIPSLPFPSALTSMQCGSSVALGGFEWDRCHEYATTM